MKRILDFAWPMLGLLAVLFSGWLLYSELRTISADEILASIAAIPLKRWCLAILSTLVAYTALAWYDRIALLHLRKPLGWGFISLVSFTTYALSHNIGASVFSGAAVRYRAYSTKGLAAAEIAVLVTLCSFTFLLGTIMLGGFVLIVEPSVFVRLFELPLWVARFIGILFLLCVLLYVFGSILKFRPISIGSFQVFYPRPEVVLRQLFAAPIELLGAAGIIYFALPPNEHVTFFSIVGLFLGSFSAALLSNAPGGLGVLEYLFLKAAPDLSVPDVIAALLVFRLLYLLIPLIFACGVVLIFERKQFLDAVRKKIH